MELLYVLRLTHLVSGVGWLGEVIVVNFVLLPVLFRAAPSTRILLLETVFPYIFRLATVLGGVALVSGLLLVLRMTDLDLTSLVETPWGQRILVSGLLGTLLYGFHLFQESGLERSLAGRLAHLSHEEPEAAEPLLRRLRLFPRVGMLILVLVVVLMSAAARLP